MKMCGRIDLSGIVLTVLAHSSIPTAPRPLVKSYIFLRCKMFNLPMLTSHPFFYFTEAYWDWKVFTIQLDVVVVLQLVVWGRTVLAVDSVKSAVTSTSFNAWLCYRRAVTSSLSALKTFGFVVFVVNSSCYSQSCSQLFFFFYDVGFVF